MMYNDFLKLIEEGGYTIKDLPLTAENDAGELVILSVVGFDNDDNPIWRTETLQENEYVRINIYHPDGTVEEMYEK